MRLLDGATAQEVVEAAVPQLEAGAAQAGRAASLLGWIREVLPEVVGGVDDAIVGAVEALLPEADPDLAGRLGAASRDIAAKRFDRTLKAMRKSDDHGVRQAAAAFESGRSGR